jgi:NAD(P)-dependent dehydrogenase (short-subunit alcohol dehydrogenase family)
VSSAIATDFGRLDILVNNAGRKAPELAGRYGD